MFISVGAQAERRSVQIPRELSFQGQIAYGSGNHCNPTVMKGKRVVILGSGAFAVEQARMGLRSGALHVTLLTRSGITCIPRSVPREPIDSATGTSSQYRRN